MVRLDHYLVESGLCESGNRAQNIIKSGRVKVDNLVVKKSSFKIDNQNITILKKRDYVSRSGWKLRYFLDSFFVDIKDKNCLDIGASTGGFTQLLLEEGAKSVTALDVGTNQLHKSLHSDSRVNSIESTDIRNFYPSISFDVITCDVAFISINNILADIDRLSSGVIIVLFKPQFEVGRAVKRTKSGVIKDSKAIELVKKRFEANAQKLGWTLEHEQTSQLKGKEGNVEYFYCFTRH